VGESCYFCDEQECLEEHHIVPKRFGGADTEDNLVKVCPTCHSKLKSLYDKRFYKRLGSLGGGLKDYGVFECVECGWKFIAEVKGEFPSCPKCMTEDDEFMRVERVSHKFAEFGEVGDLEDCSPSRDFFVWYVNSDNLPKLLTTNSYEQRIDAQEKAWELGLNENVESSGFVAVVSLDEVDDEKFIADQIFEGSI
jgi:hypothetical protein